MGGVHLLVILLITLGFGSNFALSAPPPECIQTLSDVRLLKSKLYFEVEQLSPEINRVTIVNSKDKVLGQLQFQYDSKSADLHISPPQIKKKYKGRGLSKLLQAYAVSLNPDTRTITVDLNEKNENVFNQALTDGNSIKGAIKKTSVYKAVALLGFKKVKWVDWDEEDGFPLVRVKRKVQ